MYMVAALRHALYSPFLSPFGMESVTIFCLILRLQHPSQNRTCGSPAYGSSASFTQHATMCKSYAQCMVQAKGIA